MTFDYKGFSPDTAQELVDGLGAALTTEAQSWFERNRDQSIGYLRSISEAVIQTNLDYAAGRIDKGTVAFLMRAHKRAMKVYLNGLKYETYEFRQTILNAAVRALGYAVLNRTGVNVAPHLVQSG